MRTRTLIFVAFGSLTLLALGCRNQEAQAQAKKTRELVTDPTVPVRVTPVVSSTLTEELQVTGTITTSETSTVGPTAAGRLVSVLVRDGDSVHAGQVVAQQETADLTARLRQAQAQADSARSALQQARNDARVGPTKSAANVRAANARLGQAQAALRKAQNGARPEERTQAEWTVRRAKSDLDTAKAALDRANNLFAQGALAKVDVEQAENRYSNALAAYEGALQSQSMTLSQTRQEDIDAARENVRAAEEALRSARADQRLDVQYAQRVEAAQANYDSALEQVRLARKALSDASIRSPFNGKVSGKPVQPGTYVAPGTPVATIVGSGGVYFEANVPETRINEIPMGAPVQVTVDALGGVHLTGTVTAVNPQASTQGRVFSLRIGLAENIGKLRPGMFARGTVELGQLRNVPVVPTQALIRDGEATYVFAVSNGSARKIPVKSGLESRGLTQVSGLPVGTNVVVTGQTGLVEGSKVKVEPSAKGA